MLQPDEDSFFPSDLSTLFICRRLDDLPRTASAGLDNLCDK